VAGYFTKIEVADPPLIPQFIWENLPPGEKDLLTEAEFSSSALNNGRRLTDGVFGSSRKVTAPSHRSPMLACSACLGMPTTVRRRRRYERPGWMV